MAHATPDGRDNFRFAAAANVAPGTPFFPVSYHDGPDAVAIGVEAAPIVARVFADRPPLESAAGLLRAALDAALLDVEQLTRACATDHGMAYGGIDPSPAPLGDRSIAGAIESLTGRPFGERVDAARLRHRHRSAQVASGPNLRLRRADAAGAGRRRPCGAGGEGRYGLRDLLLYSSVCGTGLDVVPVPGDTASIDRLTAVIGDVAALPCAWASRSSARLCLVPAGAPANLRRSTTRI